MESDGILRPVRARGVAFVPRQRRFVYSSGVQELSEAALPGVGDIVDGKYRIEGLVGQGAMGSVYRATHLTLGHHVAIKFLRAALDNDSLRARFVREARGTMILRNEHIVRVFDLGVLPSTMPYMVLEFLDGIDLRSLLDHAGGLATDEAVDYALQICEALAEAHLHGIVHRDLKPHNLFRIQRPNGSYCIKLLDFGVSKFQEVAAPEHELTASQILLGSPAFMPPEQIRSSSRVDARADIWSLGVVLYMLLGGGRPFDGEGLPSLCAAIMVDPPKPLAGRIPTVPVALESVIFRCLEKSRERRYASAGEVATALEPFASESGRGSAARARDASSRLPSAIDVFVDFDGPTPSEGVAVATMAERTADEPSRALALGTGLMLALVSAPREGGRAVPVRARSKSSGAAPVESHAAPLETPPQPVTTRASSRVRVPHASKPVTGAGATSKKSSTLDRNGVPILD